MSLGRSDETTLRPAPESPLAALAGLILDPKERLLRRWNWKAAILSALVRGTIFFCANIGAGFAAAVSAMCLEAALYATVAGFFGAIVQAFRKTRPVWAAAMILMVLLPVVDHALEYVLHYANGTKKLAAGMAASISLSTLSAAFNLFAMRRGALIVGEESAPLIDDLRRAPRVVFDFFMAIPRALWRIRLRHRDTEAQRRL